MKKFPGEIKRGKKRKVLLTDEQIEWVVKNYPKHKNAELTAAMGVHYWTLKKLADVLGVKKDAKWLKSIQRKNHKEMVMRMKVTGFYERFKEPGALAKQHEGLRKWLAAGHRPLDGKTPAQKAAIRAKQSKSMKEAFAKERMRIKLGLERKMTRPLLDRPFTRKEVNCRHTATAKHGYLLDYPTPHVGAARYTIYYDSETKRSALFERNAIRLGFQFRPDD